MVTASLAKYVNISTTSTFAPDLILISLLAHQDTPSSVSTSTDINTASSDHIAPSFTLITMLPVCTDDLYYKREADWVGHKFRPHPWRYQELLTPMGPEAYKAVYWDQD